jgi:N-acetyl-anhydromuramyl-L-alanine amidase AmpD
MNAVQLLNVYAPYFANPTDKREKSLQGQPIWSNHFKNNKQVFYLYHWLMRMDGTFERLLDDDQIGWHAGNWDINKRSIGICLDNDYENQDPTDEVLRKLAHHIKQNYPQIKPKNVIGHREARDGTICPGQNFLTIWKPKLLRYLQDDT